MALPFDYEQVTLGEFGGAKPTTTDFDKARVVILPIPLDRTTSYVPGTRLGPHEILVASSHMELWDEETETDVHGVGIYTLPELELPFGTMDEVMKEIRRVASELVTRGKFPVVLGGEHSITAPVVAAVAAKHPGLSVLQSLSTEEAAAAPSLATTIFYDFNMRQGDDWMGRVVDSLAENVYITIDCDGLDPAIMPAVGTPEPGGLNWYETMTLLRRVIQSRRVVGCDLVELCPIPGFVAPNFLCAKLLYKILSYRFGSGARV